VTREAGGSEGRGAPKGVVRRQLPAMAPHFAGRAAALAELDMLFADGAGGAQ
jgi:hypothetical protein